MSVKKTLKVHGVREAVELASNSHVVFTMDGSHHEINSITGCCEGFGKKCECGGFMHYQPVYGGYYYKCEKCLAEA